MLVTSSNMLTSNMLVLIEEVVTFMIMNICVTFSSVNSSIELLMAIHQDLVQFYG